MSSDARDHGPTFEIDDEVPETRNDMTRNVTDDTVTGAVEDAISGEAPSLYPSDGHAEVRRGENDPAAHGEGGAGESGADDLGADSRDADDLSTVPDEARDDVAERPGTSEADHAHADELVDEWGEESFPASDPPAHH